MLLFLGRRIFLIVSEEKYCYMRVCVYVELFPRKVCKVYKGEKFQDVGSRNVFRNRFYCGSMENVV